MGGGSNLKPIIQFAIVIVLFGLPLWVGIALAVLVNPTVAYAGAAEGFTGRQTNGYLWATAFIEPFWLIFLLLVAGKHLLPEEAED